MRAMLVRRRWFSSSSSASPAAGTLERFTAWVQQQLLQQQQQQQQQPPPPPPPPPPLPSVFRGPHGLGLRAPPQGKGYRAGQTVLRIPLDLWGPWSAHFALGKAQAVAPSFHDALTSLDGAGRSTVRSLKAPMALATHLALALVDPTDPGHLYARLLYETSLQGPPHPLLLTDANALRGYFQASPLCAAVEKRQQVYAAVHRRLFPQPEQQGKEEASSPVPFPLFLWAITRVLSRAISGGQKSLTLVPFFDFLNHAFDPNCAYELDPSSYALVVQPLRDVRPGEELTICYGEDKDNHRLLMTYGFADPGTKLPVQLTLPFPGTPPAPGPLGKRQRALLRRLKIEPPVEEVASSVVIGGATAERKQRKELRRAMAGHVVLSLGHGPEADALLAAAEAHPKGGRSLRNLVIRAAAPERSGVLGAAIDARLRAYGTSLEEDRAALQQEDGDARLDGLQRSALYLRVEEKGLLTKARAWASEDEPSPSVEMRKKM